VFFLTIGCLPLVSRSSADDVVQLIKESGDEIIITFKVPAYSINKYMVNGKECRTVAAQDAAYTSEKGAPLLPKFAQSVILPDNRTVSFEILDVFFREITIDNVIPSRGVIYRNQNLAAIPYVFGDVYANDAWYPKETVLLGTPFILRDIRGAVVSFYPFQYNPVRKILRVAESITVKIKPVAGPVINPCYSTNKRISPAFAGLYQRRFINYQNHVQRGMVVGDGEKMIVICATPYVSAMKPVIDWKNRTGIRTTLYEYPSQTGGSGADSLKAFIQNRYDKDTITYIMLVGDAANIPTLKGTISGLSDPSFTKLAGTDHYPDAFIGRLSVESLTHAYQIVDKILRYEQQPDQNGDWYSKAIGMACDMTDSSGVSDEDWMDEMCKMMLDSKYTHIDKVYESQTGTLSQVVTALNEGRGWFNYQGHGTQTSFGFPGANVTSYTFKSSKNTNKLPVVICVACNTGEFDYKFECIAEAATRAAGVGAVAFLGSYIAQPFEPPQQGQKEIVRLLSENEYMSLGAVVYNGGSKILEVGDTATEFLETYETWHLFGDPSLLYFTAKPAALAVTHPQALDTGSQEVEITVNDSIKGRVCLYSEENGILASKIISGRGGVKMTVRVTNEKKVFLTVTARNRIPVQKEIPVGTIGIHNNNSIVHANNYIIKNVGGSVSLHGSFSDNSIITVFDALGRDIFSFKTNAETNWYRLPETFSSGLHIIAVQTPHSTVIRKSFLLR